MMEWFGKPKVDKLHEAGNIPALIKALSYRKDPAIGIEAANVLGGLGDVRAIPPLHTALCGKHDDIRESVARALGTLAITHHQAREALVTALGHKNPAIRQAAAIGLGQTGDVHVIPLLLEIISKQDTDALDAALQAIEHIGRRLSPDDLTSLIVEPFATILETIRTTPLRDPGHEALEWLGWQPEKDTPLLSDEEIKRVRKQIKLALLKTLEHLKWQPDASAIGAEYCILEGRWDACVAIGVPAVEPLLEAFREGDEQTRQQAYLALVHLGPSAAEPLLQALNSDIADMQRAAFAELVKLGDRAIPEIQHLLSSESREVRRCCAWTLGKIGSPTCYVPLIEAFFDLDTTVRREVHQSLLTIGEPVIPILVAALKHPNDEVRWGVAGTLDALGWKPGNDENAAAYWIIKGRWEACIEIGTPAIALLIERFSHWDPYTCQQAADTVARMGSVAIPALLAALADERYAIRKYAAITLGTLDDERVVRPLQFLATRDPVEEIRQIASDALLAMEKKRESREWKRLLMPYRGDQPEGYSNGQSFGRSGGEEGDRANSFPGTVNLLVNPFFSGGNGGYGKVFSSGEQPEYAGMLSL